MSTGPFFHSLVKDGIRHRDTPITAYEQNNGTAQLYVASVKTLLSTYKKDFSYLSTTEMIHYDEYKELVNQYLKYKDMFYPFKIK